MAETRRLTRYDILVTIPDIYTISHISSLFSQHRNSYSIFRGRSSFTGYIVWVEMPFRRPRQTINYNSDIKTQFCRNLAPIAPRDEKVQPCISSKKKCPFPIQIGELIASYRDRIFQGNEHNGMVPRKPNSV